jgi:uncharacterized protein HemX
MKPLLYSIPLVLACLQAASGFALVAKARKARRSLNMVDQNVIMGGGIVVAGLAAGIGLVAFTEQQGERSKARGGGLSEGMATRITGGLMEDVEVSSVDDLGSLTSQLEKALKEAGGADDEQLAMSEEKKRQIEEDADDGW